MREVREEAACDVAVNELLFGREFQPETIGDKDGDRPALLLIFRCNLAAGSEPSMPLVLDPMEIDVIWVKLDDLGSGIPLLPSIAKNILTALHRPGQQTLFTSHRRG